LTTCSPKNNDFLKSLGADATYNYNDADCGQKINKDTNDSLKLAWDCIGPDSGPQICAAALSSDPKGARYGSIAGVKWPRKDGVETMNTMMYTIFDEAFKKFGVDFPKSPEDFEFARKFFQLTEKLLAEGKLKTHPEEVRGNGLEGALQGMQDMKDGKISAAKLVYRIADTPAGSSASAKL
jgi:NADPH:quinone reductase-like Zn-dependent oxidoreductase